MLTICNEVNATFTTASAFGSFCCDTLTEGCPELTATVTINRVKNPDYEEKVLQTFKIVIHGAEDFNLLEEYLNGLLALYNEWDYDTALLILVDKYYTTYVNKACMTEHTLRTAFNHTFNTMLDETKSAGSMYVGDNGSYILEYYDISVEEYDTILAYLKQHFIQLDMTAKFEGCSLVLHIS